MEDNTKHPIDELFRSKLNEEHLAPEDSLWDEVETLLNKKKKRRFLALWLTLLLLATGTSGYYLYTSHNTAKLATANSSINAPAVQSQANNKNAVANSQVTAGDNVTTANSVNNNPINNGNVNTKETVNAGSIVSSSISKSYKNSNTTTNVSSSSNSNAKNAVAAPAAIAKSHKVSSHTSGTSASKGSVVNSNALNANTPLTSSTNAAGNVSQGVKDNINPVSGNEPADGLSHTAAGAAKPVVQANVTGDKKAEGDSANNITPVVKTEEANKVVIQHHHKSDTYWYVQVNTGYMNNSHTISAASSVDPYYINKRGNDEKRLSTLDFSVEGGFMRKNLVVNTGLGITRYGEKIEYDSTKNDAQGDFIKSHNGPQVNTYLTIPVQASFVIPIKRVKLVMGAGPSVSIPLSWNSCYLNKTADGIENPGSLKMISSVVISFNLSLHLDIPITPRFDAIISGNYRRNINDIFKSAYGVNQEYLGVGGGIGLRYVFGRR